MTKTRRAVCEALTFWLALATLSMAADPRAQSDLGPGRKWTTIERLKIEHLRAVHDARTRFANERKPVSLKMGYNEYSAVLHAHAEDATHTGGTRPELLAAAKQAGIQIVMLTDHVRPGRDFIIDSWRGLRDGVLFIPGAEDRGFLCFPIQSTKDNDATTVERYVSLVRGGGGNIFLSHVEERLDWPTDQIDGLEIYNHHTDVKDEAAFSLWLQGSLTDPVRLAALVSMLAQFPEEVFGAQQDYLSSIIAKWDRDSQVHPITGIAANDCHHNQVFSVTAVDEATVEIGYITSKPTTTRATSDKVPAVAEMAKGRRPGELIALLDFDPYERSLRYVSTHILARALSETAVRDALKRGHAFVAHDWLCDSAGFLFESRIGRKATAIMGDEVRLNDGLTLSAETPIKCRMKLIRNGEVIAFADARRLDFEVRKTGVYRIECWLEVDGEQRPWIYANPIYVR